MTISEHEQDGIIIISLEGDMIGGPGATLLIEKLREYLKDGKNNFVLNMSQIEWMNSSGLGILMGGLTTVRQNDGQLKLANVTEKILELLRITKLNRVFDLFSNELEAIESFSK
ncbi:STAS domain-containing protein [bacterium]|nr:STAS domain-containing protein [bacterium]